MPEPGEQQGSAPNQLKGHQRLRERAEKKQLVYREDTFDEEFFFHYLRSEHVERTHQALTEKRFTLKRSDVGTRVINHWESEGVIEDPREDGTGWRRFSILDMTWLHAVVRLRSFGMPIDKLKRTRRSLESLGAGVTKEGLSISFYEFYLTRALLRVPVFLIVFEDGEVELATEREYSAGLTRLLGGLADHVRISLNDILQRLFPNIDLTPELDASLHVSDEELEVLITLRTGNYQSVTIKYRNDELDRIEAEEDASGRRIIDILRDADYQDVVIKRRDGKEVSVRRTLLKKL